VQIVVCGTLLLVALFAWRAEVFVWVAVLAKKAIAKNHPHQKHRLGLSLTLCATAGIIYIRTRKEF